MKGFAAVVEPVLTGRGINGHPADGIAHARLGGSVMLKMCKTGAAARACGAACICVLRFRQIAFSIAPLEKYTLEGYIGRMRKDIKASCQKRLSRIEGQVRGLSKMVDEDRYCIDIVTQISAVRAALRRVEEEVLRDHVSHCVEHAIASGDKSDQRQKIAELMDVIGRSDR